MHEPLALTPGRRRPDRDLGAVAGLTGDRGDLDGAVGDLGHLEREELLHQVGVGARERDLRPAHPLAHRHHQALDPLTVLVALPRHPLAERQQRLELAEVDHHVVGVAALLDDTGDQVALLAGELAVPDVVLGVAQPLQHDLLRGRGRDPPEALGGVVVLRDLVALVVELRGEHRDVAALPVELHPRLLHRARGLVVRREQRLLDGLDEDIEGDLLLALERAQDRQVDVHGLTVLPVELDLDQRLRDGVELQSARRARDVEGHSGLVALTRPARSAGCRRGEWPGPAGRGCDASDAAR